MRSGDAPNGNGLDGKMVFSPVHPGSGQDSFSLAPAGAVPMDPQRAMDSDSSQSIALSPQGPACQTGGGLIEDSGSREALSCADPIGSSPISPPISSSISPPISPPISSSISPSISPPIWLIVALAGLPQLCETAYTPALSQLAQDMSVSPGVAEYTISIYLVGFAIGVLFLGRFSDHYGRKPGIFLGLTLFALGCVGCALAPSIEHLMVWRFIQAFGGSVGSVLTQSIARDAFKGPALGRVYAAAGTALAIFPAIGPIFGGVLVQWAHWSKVFWLLLGFALVLMLLIAVHMPETYPGKDLKPPRVRDVARRMVVDPRVLGFALIIGGCNGVMFGYFAEGPFFMIRGIGLSASRYGSSFILLAAASMAGGILVGRLQAERPWRQVLNAGLAFIALGSLLFALVIGLHTWSPLHQGVVVGLVLASQMVVSFGVCMSTCVGLAQALVAYKDAIGTASSLFGMAYYTVVAGVTLGMGSLHTGSLLVMPVYFLTVALTMMGVSRVFLGWAGKA
jgi:MFS transporter, DHA1 family, multidrug resistance protein